MPRRSIWSARQRAALFDLPTDEAALLRHYTLSDDDIEQIRVRRGGHNRLGFALQLCAFRYPGRLLVAGEAIPLNVLRFIAAQLGMRAEDLDGYAVREETRREHLAEIRRIYGYRMFSGRCARDLKVWLENEAEAARSNEGLGAAVRGGVPAPAGDPAGIIDPGASLRGGTRRRRAPDRDAHRRGLRRCYADASRPAAYRGSRRRREPVRLVAPVRGGAGTRPTSTAFSIVWNSCRASIFPPICWRPFLRIALPVFAARGSATSQTGCAIFRVIAVSPSSPSVPWSGAALSPMLWSRPMTGSSARPSGVRSGAAMRAFQDSRTVLRDTLASFRTLGTALLEAKGDGAPLEEAVAAAGGWQKLEGVVAAG